MNKRKANFDRYYGLVFRNPEVWGSPGGSVREGLGGTLYPGVGLGSRGRPISSRALNY